MLREDSRRLRAVLLFSAILWGGFRSELLDFCLTLGRYPREFGNPMGYDRRPLRLRADPLPGEYIRFLDAVARQTKPGVSIVVMAEPLGKGFSYSFYRATYKLAGRRVAYPVLDETFSQLSLIGNPEYLALWASGAAPPAPWGLVWEGHGGKLWRRPG